MEIYSGIIRANSGIGIMNEPIADLKPILVASLKADPDEVSELKVSAH
jgi:hypothetical protein